MFFTARTFYQKLSGYGDTTLELLDGGGVQQAGSVDINIERDGATVRKMACEPGAKIVVRKAHLCEAAAAVNPIAIVHREPEVHLHALRVRAAAKRKVHEFLAAEILLAGRVDESATLRVH